MRVVSRTMPLLRETPDFTAHSQAVLQEQLGILCLCKPCRDMSCNSVEMTTNCKKEVKCLPQDD